MRKKLYTLTISILITFISCKNESKTENQNQNQNLNFVQTYEGTISGKYPIHLKLTSDNGNLSGNYFYDKVGTNIEIKGTLTIDNIITLSEFDEKGNQTGMWKGNIINQNKIIGTWSKPNGSSEMDFKLIATSENYEGSKNVISDSKYSNYSGTYNDSFNSGGISIGVLKLNYVGDQKVDFEITMARQDCVGDLSGTAKIDSSGNAKYSGKGCGSLTFNFSNNRVKVTERDCSQHHGMNCFFDGTYEK